MFVLLFAASESFPPLRQRSFQRFVLVCSFVTIAIMLRKEEKRKQPRENSFRMSIIAKKEHTRTSLCYLKLWLVCVQTLLIPCGEVRFHLQKSPRISDKKPVQSHIWFPGSRNQASLVERDLYCSVSSIDR